jgi:hypothetical protein
MTKKELDVSAELVIADSEYLISGGVSKVCIEVSKDIDMTTQEYMFVNQCVTMYKITKKLFSNLALNRTRSFLKME